MKKFNFKNKNGYSLIEILFYTGIFTLVFFIVINSIITFMDSFKQISKNTELIQSAQILETINREIKLANTVVDFSESGGRLVLASTNNENQIVTTSFELNGGEIQLFKKIDTGSEDLIGSLNDKNNIRVDSFVYRNAKEITAPGTNIDAVHIEMTFTSTRFGQEKSETFYTASTLRGKYAN